MLDIIIVLTLNQGDTMKKQNYCSYCFQPFGKLVTVKNKTFPLKKHRYHFIPRSYCNSDLQQNFISACQVCNLWKSDKMFNSFFELQNYLLNKWEKTSCNKKQQSAKSAKRNLKKQDLGKNSALHNAEINITGKTLLQKTQTVSAQAVEQFINSIQLNQNKTKIKKQAEQFAKQFLANLSDTEKLRLFAELGI